MSSPVYPTEDAQASSDMVEKRIADTRWRKSLACGGRTDEEVELGGGVEDAFTCARHPMMHSCC